VAVTPAPIAVSIPPVLATHRAIAPDPIGMDDSDRRLWTTPILTAPNTCLSLRCAGFSGHRAGDPWLGLRLHLAQCANTTWPRFRDRLYGEHDAGVEGDCRPLPVPHS